MCVLIVGRLVEYLRYKHRLRNKVHAFGLQLQIYLILRRVATLRESSVLRPYTPITQHWFSCAFPLVLPRTNLRLAPRQLDFSALLIGL